MNPLGLILIGLGIVFIIIGFKGSQHSVVNAIKGIKGGSSTPSKKTSTTPSNTGTAPSNPGGGIQLT